MMAAQTATTCQPAPEAGNPAIAQAAEWLVAHHTNHAVVLPRVRAQFGLSLRESIEACRQAALIRARAYR